MDPSKVTVEYVTAADMLRKDYYTTDGQRTMLDGWVMRVGPTCFARFDLESDALAAAKAHYEERLEIAKRHRRSVWPLCLSWSATEVATDKRDATYFEEWERRQGLTKSTAA